MTDRVRIHGTIKGRVQGIGYRWFVQRVARQRGLSGWVRNLSNGNVEYEAEGSRNNLEEFIEALRHGHPEAIVSDMKTEWLSAGQGGPADFDIRF